MKKLIQIILLASISKIAFAQSYVIHPNRTILTNSNTFEPLIINMRAGFSGTIDFKRGNVLSAGIRNSLNIKQLRFGIGDIAFDSNADIVIDSATRYIGIRTVNPLAQFHVNAGTSGVTPNSAPAIFIEDNRNTYLNLAAPNANETGILFGRPDDTGTSGGIIYRSNKDMHLRTNGNVTRIQIKSNGNVGIGNNVDFTPAAKLDIDGDVVIRKKTLLPLTSQIMHNLDRAGASIIATGVATSSQTIIITGIAGGVDGMMLWVYPTQFFTIRLDDEHTDSLPANRIKTTTGSPNVLIARGGATLIYDGTEQRWHVIDTN